MPADAPTEGWILSDPEMIPLREDVCGMPYVLRVACDLSLAGCRDVKVIWTGPADTTPRLDDLAGDERLRGARLSVVREVPADADAGAGAGPVVVVRGNRVYHRDLPKAVVASLARTDAPYARIAGAEHDAVFAMTRAAATTFATSGALPGEPAAEAKPPYLAFTAPIPTAAAKRRAEKLLVWSQRKEAQGIAAYWINRHLSLRCTRLIMRTEIRPNHVTVFCFFVALLGGVIMGQGGYWAGFLGMFLVNLGSIIDGVDGELARLKYRFSGLGQWLDTLADDFGNVAYVSGCALNLDMQGVTWALPLAIVSLSCFAFTQATQYALIRFVYKSGDLAAIPWAFQSNEFLTSKPEGFVARVKATLPKTLKRDFALTMFVVFAAIGFLEPILLVFSAGALTFFAVFVVQLVRNIGAMRRLP